MALKYPLTKAFLRAGRVVPSILGAILTDLDARLTAVEDKFKLVAVNISTGNGNGSSAADTTLVGGTPVSCIATGNNDQIVDNVEVLSDGKVKVTLAANATAQNTFNVLVQKV
jgi:hypothetical protein